MIDARGRRLYASNGRGMPNRDKEKQGGENVRCHPTCRLAHAIGTDSRRKRWRVELVRTYADTVRAVVLSQPNRTRPPASAVPPHPHRIPVLTSPAGTASIPGPGDATAGTAGDEQAGAARGAPNAQPQRDVLARGAAAAKQRECWCRGLSRCGRMLLLRPTPPLPGIGAATGWVSAVASKGSTSPKWRPPPNAQTRTCLASEASRGGAVTDSHPQVRHVGMT